MTTPLERALSKTLDAVERAAPPAPPDLVKMVNQGLRHRRRRHLATASAAFAAVLVTLLAVTITRSAPRQGGAPGRTPTASAPALIAVVEGCTLNALALPSSFPEQALNITATDVDPTGRYVVGFVAGSTASWAMLWVDGRPQILDKDAGSEAIAVNAAGAVVGRSAGSGWVYRAGHRDPLPKLPGTSTADPVAINGAGDIVGQSGARVVIWPADHPGQVRPVGAGAGTVSGISDGGLIVGVDSNNESRLWNRDGTIHPLPAGFAYRPQAVAGQWVLGVADAIGNNTGPVGVRFALWNVTTGAITPLATATTAVGFLANALSESGVLVGYFINAGHQSRPAAFRDGQVILLRMPEGHSDDVEARAISADGRTIVGTGGPQALLWHC